MLSTKTYFQLTGYIFLLVGVLHLLRLIFQLGVVFGGWEIPIWTSWVGVAVAGYLAYKGFQLAGKSK